MGRSSREKGKRGEREAAEMLRALGFGEARRGVQYQGGPGSPDVVGIPGIHLEIKRAETLSIYAALEQAIAEAAEGEVPVVLHRRNGRPWVAIVQLCEFGLAADAWRRARDL